ncbi:MAG: hypothetical protein J1D99_04865 [Campylobacter sp.]|nr:hypothetical protein [Campylobacter sp.]
MAFMNFKGFFYARNDLKLFKIEKVSELDGTFYRDYILVCAKDELNLENEIFFYKSIQKDLFRENDEILISNWDKKIILFRNFTRKTNNFKEAVFYQFVLLVFLFIASAFFATLASINEFSAVDLMLFMLCLLLLVMALINFSLLQRQIQILAKSGKENIREFLRQKMQKK